MRVIFLIISFYCFLVSCGNDKTINQGSNQKIVNDTISNEFDYSVITKISERRDTSLLIDNIPYTLTYSALLDTTKKLVVIERYSKKGKNYKDIYRGYNAIYNITLRNNTSKIVFSKTLTKNDFKDIFIESIATQSNANLPHFMGFLPTFNSFIFTIDFWVPDSDVGGQCFFIINKNGEIKHNSMNNYFGGADCDGEVEIPKNENFILTCRKIINSNGKTIDISDKDRWQVGTKLINDNCILVIQDYDTTKKPNTMLIDIDGKILKRFIYQGYYEILGYRVPMHFDSLTSNYFLLDEELKNVRIINKNYPTSTFTVAFDEMEASNNDKKENEIEFKLNTEMTENTFYLDTISNQMRREQK